MKSPFTTMMALLLVVSALWGFSRTRLTREGLGIYPEVAPFTAVPAKIQAGDPVTLSWSSRGAVSLRLETMREVNGAVVTAEVVTGLPPAGSLKVQPEENTTWRMRCETVFSGQSCNAIQAKVEVTGAPPRIVPPVSGGF